MNLDHHTESTSAQHYPPNDNKYVDLVQYITCAVTSGLLELHDMNLIMTSAVDTLPPDDWDKTREIAGSLHSTTVPEPATMPLFGVGLAEFCVFRKKFKK